MITRFLVFATALFFPIFLQAQPILTAATSNPLAGDVFLLHTCQTAGVAPGASGVGLTWDFSALISTKSQKQVFLPDTSTPYYSSFPGCNIAVYDSIDNAYTYCYTGTDKYSQIGYHTLADGNVLDTNWEDILYYPFTYNSVHADSTRTTFHEAIYDTSYGDGYGTLILPFATFSNVLRIHMHRTTIVYTSSYRTEYYAWYAPGFHFPLLEIVRGYGASATYVTGVYYSVLKGLGAGNIVADRADVQVYPNPIVEVLKIKSFGGKLVGYTLTDCMGRITSQGQCINEITAIDAGSLPPGVYYLKLTHDTYVEVRKIEKL